MRYKNALLLERLFIRYNVSIKKRREGKSRMINLQNYADFTKFALPNQNGECSSVGRAPVCGSGCRGFNPRRSPGFKRNSF